MKKKIVLSLLMLANFGLFAQEKDKHWIGVETDPISTVFGARTLSVLIEPPKIEHWSLFLNVVHADFPNWMDDFLNPNNKGKDFDTWIRIGGGVGLDYFTKEEREGLYFGLLNLFFQNDIISKNQNDVPKSVLTHNVIPRVGYRWFPFQKIRFYVNPFVGLRYEYSLGEPQFIDGKEFLAAGIQPFGTVHIGYHF